MISLILDIKFRINKTSNNLKEETEEETKNHIKIDQLINFQKENNNT